MHDYDLLPCGVFIIDISFKIQYCNAPFALLINTPFEKIIDCSLDNLLSNGSKILFQQIVLPSILIKDQINEIQLNFINPENQKTPMLVFARRDKTQDNNIILCCFSAKERD
jgi:PAS domain-containing protein